MATTLSPSSDAPSTTTPSNPYLPHFAYFRTELDTHHDTRERVIKASRDITALSKKMIFTLQRHSTLPSPVSAALLSELTPRLSQIHTLLSSLTPDLQPGTPNVWRYQRQLSGAMQEFVEAVAFWHYLQTQSLITPEEARRKLVPEAKGEGEGEIRGETIMLTDGDYLLGLFDLVGEMMRWGITHLATSGRRRESGQVETEGSRRGILEDMRDLRAEFERLDATGGYGFGLEVEKKMEVMRTCVEKVEVGVCGMMVRGKEREVGWVPDLGGGGGRGGDE